MAALSFYATDAVVCATDTVIYMPDFTASLIKSDKCFCYPDIANVLHHACVKGVYPCTWSFSLVFQAHFDEFLSSENIQTKCSWKHLQLNMPKRSCDRHIEYI